MKVELTQLDADELSSDNLATLGGLIEGFMQRTGLRFGYTLLTFDRLGVKTSGNMPPDSQREVFTMVALTLNSSGPVSVESMPVNMPPSQH